jgi:hypothetical protein
MHIRLQAPRYPGEPLTTIAATSVLGTRLVVFLLHTDRPQARTARTVLVWEPWPGHLEFEED